MEKPRIRVRTVARRQAVRRGESPLPVSRTDSQPRPTLPPCLSSGPPIHVPPVEGNETIRFRRATTTPAQTFRKDDVAPGDFHETACIEAQRDIYARGGATAVSGKTIGSCWLSLARQVALLHGSAEPRNDTYPSAARLKLIATRRVPHTLHRVGGDNPPAGEDAGVGVGDKLTGGQTLPGGHGETA